MPWPIWTVIALGLLNWAISLLLAFQLGRAVQSRRDRK